MNEKFKYPYAAGSDFSTRVAYFYMEFAQQDEADANNLYDLLEKEIIPMYYDYPAQWLSMIKNSMRDILPDFNSNRMAREYYIILYEVISPQ